MSMSKMEAAETLGGKCIVPDSSWLLVFTMAFIMSMWSSDMVVSSLPPTDRDTCTARAHAHRHTQTQHRHRHRHTQTTHTRTHHIQLAGESGQPSSATRGDPTLDSRVTSNRSLETYGSENCAVKLDTWMTRFWGTESTVNTRDQHNLLVWRSTHDFTELLGCRGDAGNLDVQIL